jgi:hypothetical protein
MMLNGTFILQACNFLCAYIILDVLLFRPVVAIITGEDALKEGKIAAIASEEKKAEIQRTRIEDLWKELRQEFAHKRPFFMPKISAFPMFKRSAVARPSSTEAQSVAAQLRDQIIERCAHVRK